MRILVLTPSIRPLGARRSLVELVRHLPPGIEPLVVCPGPGGICGEINDLGIQTAVVPHGAWRKVGGRLTSVFRQIPRLWGLVGKFRPDLLHANEFHIVPQAVVAARRRIAVCGHVRLSITPRQVRNYRLGECQRIVAVSDAVRELFAGSPIHARTRVVYNGVDVGKIMPEGLLHPELADWLAGPSGARPLVAGLLGLISERKNQLQAVEAVARARARGVHVALVLAGDPFKDSMAYGEELRRRIAAPDLAGWVRWLPFQQDVASIYRAVDVNLLISREEGFGRTIIEAAAAGRPSIGSRIGGIPELIIEGDTGLLVDEGDVEGLAGSLERLARDRDLVSRMGAAAGRHTRAHFTIEAHVRRMIEVWGECVEEQRAASAAR